MMSSGWPLQGQQGRRSVLQGATGAGGSWLNRSQSAPLTSGMLAPRSAVFQDINSLKINSSPAGIETSYFVSITLLEALCDISGPSRWRWYENKLSGNSYEGSLVCMPPRPSYLTQHHLGLIRGHSGHETGLPLPRPPGLRTMTMFI